VGLKGASAKADRAAPGNSAPPAGHCSQGKFPIKLNPKHIITYMKTEKPFSVLTRLKSFVYAFNGLRVLFQEEHNARIHVLAAVGVVVASIAFRISALEWIAVVFAIGLVFIMEIVNTVVENLADFIAPERNERIGRIKDLSAAAVLVGALASFAVGLIVFLPKVLQAFR
jgi:diacylglycerol kinase